MLPTPRPVNRILSALPMDLVHFSSFPGRFIWKASRTMGNYNSCIVVRKGLVDPDYGWREDGWWETGRVFLLRHSTKRKLRGHVAQGASLWKPGFQLAELVAAHYHSTNWFSEAEDPAMIWEIPQGETRLAGSSSSKPSVIDSDQALSSPSNSGLCNKTVLIMRHTLCNLENLCRDKVDESQTSAVPEKTVATDHHYRSE